MDLGTTIRLKLIFAGK